MQVLDQVKDKKLSNYKKNFRSGHLQEETLEESKIKTYLK